MSFEMFVEVDELRNLAQEMIRNQYSDYSLFWEQFECCDCGQLRGKDHDAVCTVGRAVMYARELIDYLEGVTSLGRVGG